MRGGGVNRQVVTVSMMSIYKTTSDENLAPDTMRMKASKRQHNGQEMGSEAGSDCAASIAKLGQRVGCQQTR